MHERLSFAVFPTGEDFLAVDSFMAHFKFLHSQMKEAFWKVERRQSYQEPREESLQAYLAGDHVRARLLLRQLGHADGYSLREARSNLPSVRIRIMELPLTPYLEWEFLTYQVSALYGERILVADITELPLSHPLRGGRDFVMFDRKTALVHNYEPDGLLKGAWCLEQDSQIAPYLEYFSLALQYAVPLGDVIASKKLPLL